MHISWVPSILVWYDVMWCWCVWFQSWLTSSVLVMSTAAASTCRDVIVTWHDTNHVFSTAPSSLLSIIIIIIVIIVVVVVVVEIFWTVAMHECCLLITNEWHYFVVGRSWFIMQTKTWASFVVERLNSGYLPSVFSRIHTSVAPSCRFYRILVQLFGERLARSVACNV